MNGLQFLRAIYFHIERILNVTIHMPEVVCYMICDWMTIVFCNMICDWMTFVLRNEW